MTFTFSFYALLTFFFVLCLLFVGLILVQKGRGGGISAAFGGAGGNTAFGSKTGDVLTWATSIVFGIFLVCCVSLSLLATQVDRQATGRGIVAPAAAAGAPAMALPAATAPTVEANQPTATPEAGLPEAITPSTTQPAGLPPSAPVSAP